MGAAGGLALGCCCRTASGIVERKFGSKSAACIIACINLAARKARMVGHANRLNHEPVAPTGPVDTSNGPLGPAIAG
jgi:hypothetical protein